MRFRASWRAFSSGIFALALLGSGACGGSAAPAPASAPAAKPAEPAKPAAAEPAKPAAQPAANPTAASAPAKPAAAGAAPASGDSVKLRLGFVISRKGVTGEFAETLSDEAKAKSNGRIQIDLFDNGQLGGEIEMLNNLRQGTMDMGIIGSGPIGSVEKAFGITELPFIWKDADTVHKVLDGPVGQGLFKSLESKAIKGLAWGEFGPRSIIVKTKAVNSADDVRGLKMRVIENPLYVATWRAFGANPVPMAWPEVYTGLQQGTIDAVDTNPTGMKDAKLYEVAKNVAVTEHIYTAVALLVNMQKWNALSPDLQKIITDAAMAGQKMNRDRAVKENNDAVEFMRQNGAGVTRPDRSALQAKVAPVYAQFANDIGADILKQVQEANK